MLIAYFPIKKTQQQIMIKTLTKTIKYSVVFNYTLNNFDKRRNMIVHHGVIGSCKNFKNFTKHHEISDYVNSYLIDCRNHSQSPHTASNKISDLADDLHEFIIQNELDKNKGLTLMGHSMGAMALMAFTQRYPQMQQFIDRVIIIDTNCLPRKQDKGVLRTKQMLKNMLEINLNQHTSKVFMQIDETAMNKGTAGAIKTNIKIIDENTHKWIPNVQTLLQDFDEFINFQLHKNEWRKPVELIYGGKSTHVNNDQIRRYCELYPQMDVKKNFYIIEGAEHSVHFENMPQFLKAMQHILQKDQSINIEDLKSVYSL